MAEAAPLVAEIEALGEKLGSARTSIHRRFIGQEKVVDTVLAAMLCGGHALLVGLPGLGKTRLVDTLSIPMLLKTVQSKRIDAKQLITHRFKLDQVLQAYDTFGKAADTKALKVIIET